MKEERLGGGERGQRKTPDTSPYVEVKGDVSFYLQFVLLCWLKYTVLCTIIVLEQLTVQKSEGKGDGELDL